MNILLTGSSGFVGKALTEKLKRDGGKVIQFDQPSYDILSMDDLNMFAGADLVIHAAAVSDLNHSEDNPNMTFDVNITGTYMVMQKCKELGIPLIYITTCCAYSPQQGESTELSIPNPVEWYARSKLAAEPITAEIGATILRIGTVLGEGMRPALFNYKVLEALNNRKKFTVYGDGSASRNYIYIEDLVNGISKAAERQPGGIFNLAGNESITINKIIKTAETVTGRIADFENVKTRDLGDYTQNINCDKARDILNWKPVVSYEEAMEKTNRWFFK